MSSTHASPALAEFQAAAVAAINSYIAAETPDAYPVFASWADVVEHQDSSELLEEYLAVAIDNNSVHAHGITAVDAFGGEGLGDEYWQVFGHAGHLFRVSGFYSSFDGAKLYWDEIHEVTRSEKIVAVYTKLHAKE